jgi:hypothetical protein
MIRKPEDLLNGLGILESDGKGFRRTVEEPSVGLLFVFHRLLTERKQHEGSEEGRDRRAEELQS